MVQRLGQQLVHSSLLLHSPNHSRLDQLWMHPIVAAAITDLQQPQLHQLLQGGQKQALCLLSCYGADAVGPLGTATDRTQTVCESAAAAVLSMPGQLQFLNSVRQAVCSSGHLAALWHQFPEQTNLLLSSLAKTDAPAIKRVSYGLLQQGKRQLQLPRESLPIRQAVCIRLQRIQGRSNCICLLGHTFGACMRMCAQQKAQQTLPGKCRTAPWLRAYMNLSLCRLTPLCCVPSAMLHRRLRRRSAQ